MPQPLFPTSGKKDGRAVLFTIVSQHAGVGKWQGIIKTAESFMKNSKFMHNSNYTLEKYCNQHRQTRILLQEAAEHVTLQLTNERTRETC